MPEPKSPTTTTAPATTTTKEKETTPPPPPVSPATEIKNNAVLIERAVSTLEPRFTHRVLRSLTTLRKKLTAGVLKEATGALYPKDSANVSSLIPLLPAQSESDVAMDVDPAPAASSTPTPASKPPTSEPIPEVDIYIRLLYILLLIDEDENDKAIELSLRTTEKIHALNRRTLDPISAKVYFYLARAHDIADKLADIRPLLLAAQRTASLRQDADSQAVLINLLLANYLHYSLFTQADKLISKTSFPSSTAGNTQLARYLFYLGRIRAVQLSYTEAHTHLQQAIRRAPSSKLAAGFYQTVHKFFIVVELLMGDIPERSLFRDPVLRKALVPYLHIVQAVRTGDLSQFQSALQTHTEQFTTDNTHKLILRLRHNVIKTGVRSLSLAYSLISLRDICVKLHLDSEEDAEYIVAKAVRDGVIDARLDHGNGWMITGGKARGGGAGSDIGGDLVGGVYATQEPREVFTKRIGFCLELHNESVKAMRYPLNAHRKELQSAEAAREREKELAKEIVDADLDEDDDVGGGGLGDF